MVTLHDADTSLYNHSKGLFRRSKLLWITFFAADNKKLSLTKHRVCESSYRVQIEKNQAVDDKPVK